MRAMSLVVLIVETQRPSKGTIVQAEKIFHAVSWVDMFLVI